VGWVNQLAEVEEGQALCGYRSGLGFETEVQFSALQQTNSLTLV